MNRAIWDCTEWRIETGLAQHYNKQTFQFIMYCLVKYEKVQNVIWDHLSDFEKKPVYEQFMIFYKRFELCHV